jgi:AcrR family transcriptional regulator
MSVKGTVMKAGVAKKSTIGKDSKDAESTRDRIFEAAKACFSRTSYEAVGVREIAGNAGVDAALVIRYFGSKEELFRQLAAEAFASNDLFEGDSVLLVERLLHQLFLPSDDKVWRLGYDPFRLLLYSIGSITAGPIISRAFHRTFVARLSETLTGRSKGARAILIASYILGVALLRIAEPQESFAGAHGKLIREKLRAALNDCVLPPTE